MKKWERNTAMGGNINIRQCLTRTDIQDKGEYFVFKRYTNNKTTSMPSIMYYWLRHLLLDIWIPIIMITKPLGKAKSDHHLVSSRGEFELRYVWPNNEDWKIMKLIT